MRIARPALAAALACTAAPALAGDGWGTASDIGRDALVVAALALPAVQGDWAGGLQAGGSLLLATGAAQGLKRIVPETRPDGSDRRSFPSNHTAMAFAAAATLEERHGWRVGLPALAAATLVAVGRVEARKHFWQDVAAGALIGTGSGLLLTRGRHAAVRLVPWAGAGGGGLALAARF